MLGKRFPRRFSMLILGDDGQYNGRFPWVTALLVVINVVVYTSQVMIGPELTIGYALVPEEVSTLRDLTGPHHHTVTAKVRGRGQAATVEQTHGITIEHYPGPTPIYLTFFTSMFLHGDVF